MSASGLMGLTVLVFVVLLSGCGPGKKTGKTKKPKSVQVAVVKQTRLVELIETTGDVVATNTVTLRASVEGPIGFCPWREGDVVERTGQKMIEISRPYYHQVLAVAKGELEVKKALLEDLRFGPRPEEIAAAKASVLHYESCTKFAKIDLDRVQSLSQKDVVSKQEAEAVYVNYVKCKTQLDSAKNKLAMLEEGTKKTELAIAATAVKKAEAALALAQTEIDECVITAPFPGIVTEVYVRPGDFTALRSGARIPLLKIMDPKSLVVRAGIPEKSAVNISSGSKVDVCLDAYPQEKFNAVIERVYPRIEWNSRTRIIEARITDKIRLIPRMFARISAQGRVFEKAVTVLDSAIITTPRGEQVVFVVKDNKAQRRKVKIGMEQGRLVQILSGLSPGELVVIAGNLTLKDGDPIKVIKEKPALKNVKEDAGARNENN